MSGVSLQAKIKTQIKAHKSSIPKLAAAIGVPEQTLMYSLREGGKIPFETVVKIARHFSLDLNSFASDQAFEASPKPTAQTIDTHTWEIATEALNLALRRAHAKAADIAREEVPLSLEAFLWWWESHSGRLENFDSMRPYVDFFEAPSRESDLIRPTDVGDKSLAAVCFKLQSAQQLSHTLEGFSAPLNRDLVSAHLTALDRGEPVITYPTLNEPLPDGSRFIGKYRRVLAPLKKDGRTIIVNFSQAVPDYPLSVF